MEASNYIIIHFTSYISMELDRGTGNVLAPVLATDLIPMGQTPTFQGKIDLSCSKNESFMEVYYGT